MRDLYKLTATEAIDSVVEEVMGEHPELTKKRAKDLVINSLLYWTVINEIKGQVNFLLETEEE